MQLHVGLHTVIQQLQSRICIWLCLSNSYSIIQVPAMLTLLQNLVWYVYWTFDGFKLLRRFIFFNKRNII